MKIGIDGRLWSETGVGRYIRALVRELGEIDIKNNYVLWLRKKEFYEVKLPNKRWQKILANVAWHTVNEQIYMPGIYKQAHADLIHIPYFSVPLYTPKPFVVTIHDLTISDFATGKATTKPKPIYWMKRQGYDFVLNKAIRRAENIITVSNTVREQIIERFKVNPDKVVAIYESGELETNGTSHVKQVQDDKNEIPAFLPEMLRISKQAGAGMTDKTQAMKQWGCEAMKNILYVGNAHPHKNLDRLIKAFQIVRQQMPEMHLVLVGKDDYFYKRLKYWVNQGNMGNKVEFINEVDNVQLVEFYKNAAVLVFPSLSEGFGIPGLEAMNLGCPVIASDIPVFKEIYGDAAEYFDPKDERSIAEVLLKYLKLLKDLKEKNKIIGKGKKQAAIYSWRKMAQETLKIYESSLSL